MIGSSAELMARLQQEGPRRFRDKEHMDRWMKAPHPLLNGRRPMDLIAVKRIDALVALIETEPVLMPVITEVKL